jgi:hypothetical protein
LNTPGIETHGGLSDSVGMLSKLFRPTKREQQSPPEHAVIIQFSYGSKNLQHVFALEDQLRNAICDAGVGEYDGHEVAVDGSDGFFYMYGPDAEALFRVISPMLAAPRFMRGAQVTLRFGPRRRRTPKRVIHLSS